MQPKCTSECQIAQRNARLAEALGIDPGNQGKSERTTATYTPELVAFAKANHSFVRMVEAALAEYVEPPNIHYTMLINPHRFVSSDRRTHALPHMPETKRNFVYNVRLILHMDLTMYLIQKKLCKVYRIDCRMVDVEPQRRSTLFLHATNGID
jgi:transcriptional repressor NF-X1